LQEETQSGDQQQKCFGFSIHPLFLSIDTLKYSNMIVSIFRCQVSFRKID